MRISRHSMFMEIAHVIAKRSTCFRLNVGAVIVANKRIIGTGYNGPAAGENHCTGNDCAPPGSGCGRAVHAEINALRSMPVSSRDDAKVLYVTASPCKACLTQINNSLYRITAIYYGSLYRVSDHLNECPIPLFRITPSGYVIDHKTNEIVEAP